MDSGRSKHQSIEVSEATFDDQVLRSAKPVLVVFSAPWSHPCQRLEAVIEQVAATCGETLKVVRVDADEHPDLSLWYEIQSIPTLLYFVAGALRVKLVGTASKEAILAKLRSGSPADAGGASPLEPDQSDEHRDVPS